jgi:hypothetical protein
MDTTGKSEVAAGNLPALKVDQWVWGTERILWGFEPRHQYTFKALEPKLGIDGCMSLQYHHEKSETWLVLRGALWTLFIADGQISTRIMRPRDGQHILTGVIHRLAGMTPDAQVLEPSTPDRHAADKSVQKDVVRLHCFHGRPVVAGRDAVEQRLIDESVEITRRAMDAIAAGRTPEEIRPELMNRYGAFVLP